MTTSDGRAEDYVVSALQVVAKRDGIPASALAQDGPPRLMLITCGGPFDEATLSYRDNIVVTAMPAG